MNKAYDLGANSYLVKPVAFDALLNMVQTLGSYWLILNERPDAGRIPDMQLVAAASGCRRFRASQAGEVRDGDRRSDHSSD